MSHCGLGLSCDPLPCEHGKQIRKEQCHLCEIKKQLIDLTEMYKSLSESHHEFKLMQIMVNRELNSCMDDSEFVENNNVKIFENILDRIEKLEELNKQCFDANPIKQIEDRFAELENRLESHRHDVEKELKPYKCPVCNGKGNVIIDGNKFLLSNPPQYPVEICKVCGGKGIVWD